MAKYFEVEVYEGTTRAEDFLECFGRLDVKVSSPIPVWCVLPGFEQAELCYMLDLSEITGQEMTKLIRHLARKFDLGEWDVEHEIESAGVPIRIAESMLTVF